jgi:hypothetical protein
MDKHIAMDALSLPTSGLLRLFRSAVISKAERRRRFFKQTIDKEFASIKQTHDRFRSILTKIDTKLDTLIAKFGQRDKRLTSKALSTELLRIHDQTMRARAANQTLRRELYEECQAFLEISNPYKNDVLLVFNDDEIVEIQTFMSRIVTYFQTDMMYKHEVGHAMREIEDLLSKVLHAFDKEPQKIIDYLALGVAKIATHIEVNETRFAEIARQYAKLRFVICRE